MRSNYIHPHKNIISIIIHNLNSVALLNRSRKIHISRRTKTPRKLLRHFVSEALRSRKYGERFYAVLRTNGALGYVVAIKVMDQRYFQNVGDMAHGWKVLLDYNKFKGAPPPQEPTMYRSKFFSALNQKRVFPGGNVQSLNKDRVVTEYGIHPKDHYRYFLFSWDNRKLVPKWPIGPEDVDHSTPMSSLDQNNQIIELPGFGNITLHHDLQSNSFFIRQIQLYDFQSNSLITLHEATNSTEHMTDNSNESMDKMEIGEPLPPTFEGEGGFVDTSTSSELDDALRTVETSPQRSPTVDQHSDILTEPGDDENIYSTSSKMDVCSEINRFTVQRSSEARNGVEPSITQSINQTSTDEEYLAEPGMTQSINQSSTDEEYSAEHGMTQSINQSSTHEEYLVESDMTQSINQTSTDEEYLAEPGMTQAKYLPTNDEGYFDSMSMTLSEEGTAFESFRAMENYLKLNAVEYPSSFCISRNFIENHVQSTSDTIIICCPDANNESKSKVEFPSNKGGQEFNNSFPMSKEESEIFSTYFKITV